MAAAAAMAQTAAPGAFTFLKHGVVLPARRPGLFLRVFALSVVLSAAVHLFGVLVMASLDAAVNAADAKFSMSRVCLLMGAGVAYLFLYLAAWLVKKVAAACAAVAACSGDRHAVTLGFVLRRVRASLLRVSATVALGAILRAACAAAAAAAFLAPPLALYLTGSPRLLLLGALLAALALRLCFHLEAVCAMAVVVAAAEPGGAGGAVLRAWRLMRGTGGGERALVYVVATWAMQMAAGPVGDVAVRRLLPRGMDRVVVLVVGACLKYVLNFVVDVVSMTSIAAYYFEGRKKDDEKEKAGHID
ncbi:unnamed protein product [Urochloa decumbens]|uniref:Uncharacterized protein n=1 Tax=Urochloa decumbens TaxID=240449 RepID=A0ABC9BSQ1_9POAL